MKENIILNQSFEFALKIVKYCEVLYKKKQFIIGDQPLKSGTSIGANVYEAQHAESKADFIHKMKIAAKEASETLYWLILCERSETYVFDQKLMSGLDEIIKILSKIINVKNFA